MKPVVVQRTARTGYALRCHGSDYYIATHIPTMGMAEVLRDALNAIIAINPDHPEVVAEGIGSMYRTLDVVLGSVRRRLVKWEQGCLKESDDSSEYGCDKMFEKTLSDLIARLEAKG